MPHPGHHRTQQGPGCAYHARGVLTLYGLMVIWQAASRPHPHPTPPPPAQLPPDPIRDRNSVLGCRWSPWAPWPATFPLTVTALLLARALPSVAISLAHSASRAHLARSAVRRVSVCTAHLGPPVSRTLCNASPHMAGSHAQLALLTHARSTMPGAGACAAPARSDRGLRSRPGRRQT